MPEYEFVKYEELEEGKIVRILLDRPDTRNAQNRGMLVELDDAFRDGREGRRPCGWSSSAAPARCSPRATTWARPSRSRSGPRIPTSKIDGATRQGAENRMLQEWHYFFQNTLRWRNLRKITVAQVQGTVFAAGLMLMWACDLIVAAENAYFADVVGTRLGMCGIEYFGHPWEFGPRRAKELMLTGDAIERPGGAPAGHGLEDLPDRRALRADPRLRPADRRAAHDGGPAHQGVGEPDGRQHGLLQLAAGLLHPAPAEPLPLGRGPREQVPGGHGPRTGSPTGGTRPRSWSRCPTRSRDPPPSARRPAAQQARGERCTSRTSPSRHPTGPPSSWASPVGASPIEELDEGSIRFARVLHDCGLRRGDHFAVLLENHPSYFEIVWAGMRSGLYITAVNSHLTAAEAGYIVDDCGAKVLVTSAALGELADALVELTPGVEHRFMVDGTTPGHDSYEDAVAAQPAPTPLAGAVPGDGHALQLGHHRAPQGDQVPSPPGGLAARGVGDRRAQPGPLRLRRGHGLLEPGPALPRRSAAGGHGGPQRRRDRGRHGAVRSRAGAGADRARAGHPQPVGAHDVRPHAEAAPGRADSLRPLAATGWPPTPPRPARCT